MKALASVNLGGFLGQPYMQHALLAGTAIALAAGLIGYFLVLRSQVFTVDALGHVTYTGAMAALAFAFDPLVGLFVATIVIAAGMAGLGSRARADDVVIGSTFAWILGLGAFFQTLYTTNHSAAGNGRAGVTYLFGSIFGISSSQAVTAALVGLGVCIVTVLIARPLLFASLDEAVAAARGVPVRSLGVGFLVLVGITCAESAQAVGALLLLGLIAAPAGAAHRLTTRPYLGLALSAAIAVGATWVGLLFSYLVPATPPSFSILSAATLAYVASYAMGRRPTRSLARSPRVAAAVGHPH
ncbi:MAG: zinc/manganese transport system permease protein [Actinomycetota bacterium]|nr:zinc/manganese transport system permease protein [Actinomycetota bacterium]